MAYRIGRHWDGFYVLSRIRAASLAIAEIERRLRVTEGVLRFITVRFDRDQAKLERRRAKKAAEEQARGLRRGPVAAEGRAEVAEADTVKADGDAELNGFGGGSEESPDGGSRRHAGRAPEGVAGPEGVDQAKPAGEEN